ncbi:MAG: N-acetylmuramoyl-L-alanine amidase [Candidatus Omnitrophica bacterium]|nr:N-acetylmuramoyl-L-alanine amidase [Candidatus Omnitrophota bacterium]
MRNSKFRNESFAAKKSFKFGISILIFTFSILNLYGCATYPRRAEVKKPILPADKTFRIGKTDYVYLKDFCRFYDFVWDWDILGKKLVLYRNGFKINLALGSTVGLINEKRIDLKNKVQIYNNEIALPFGLAEEVSKILFPSLPAKLPTPSVYKIKCVVIDPGHGGKDPGAVGPAGLKEKEVVLDIAKRLKKYLEKMGLEVVLTRKEDKFVSLWRRVHLANTKKADLFISIHANSSRYREARGFEIYYLSDRMDDSSKALVQIENAALEFEEGFLSTENTALAATLWDIVQTQNRAQAMRLANHIASNVESFDWLDNRGIKGANFYVLKGANMPALLVETGFISNRIESRLLADPYYSQRIAEAIGKGIISYKEEYERTDGFSR